MARLILKNDYPIDTFYDEIIFAQKIKSTILGSIILNTIWKDTCDHFKRKEIFALTSQL